MIRAANERGVILVFALGMMLALLLVGAASSLFTRSDQRLSGNLRSAARALFLAEAGVGWAQHALRGADAGLWFDSARTVEDATGALDGGTWRVDVTARDASGRRVVAATGIADGGAREVTATFRRFGLDPAGPDDCLRPGDADANGRCDGRPGIVAARSLAVSAGSLVDSYRGDSGAYSAGSAGTNGHLAANGPVTLAGSGTWVRGSVFRGTTLAAGSNAIDGGVETLPPLFLPPLPAYAAVCGAGNPQLVDCNPPYGAATVLLAGTFPDETLTVGAGQTVCMPPGAYCYRQVLVQSGGTLRFVDPVTGAAGPTTLQLGAGAPALRVEGRLEFGTGMRPSLLRVFARGDVRILGWSGARVLGLVYAPASAARLNGNDHGNVMDFHGALFAGEVVLGGGPVRFHVDEDARFGSFCADAADPTCHPAFVVREEWTETRS